MEQWQTVRDGLEKAYRAWHDSKGASIDTWLALFADHVDFRSLAGGNERVPWTRTHTSREQIRGYLEGLTDQFAMLHYAVERYVCQGDTIVAIGTCSWTNKATGKTVETPKVDIWRAHDGKIVAFHEFYDTAGLIASTGDGSPDTHTQR